MDGLLQGRAATREHYPHAPVSAPVALKLTRAFELPAAPRCLQVAMIAEETMYLACFSYDVAPANRERALQSMHHELDAARKKGLEARILIPLTRAHGGPALQFEVTLTSLDQLEEFRHRGAGSRDETS